MCPDPVTVEQDGVQDISGSVSNDLGASATTVVTVRVDRTAPILSIESPTISSIVSPGPLTISGMAADSLSEVSVTCDGQAAVVTELGFSCGIVAPAGSSTVVVQAVDQAQNMRVVTLDVDTSDLQARPPTSLRVTPQEVTMRIGENRRFSLMDDLGRVPHNAVWAIDDPNVASLATTPRLEMTALVAGQVTLTATWQGHSATTHVTVSPLDTLPAGTTTWSAPPIHGTVKKIVQGAVGPDGTRLTYVLESTGEAGSEDVVRAFDEGGGEQWVRRVTGLVAELSTDAMGGALVLVGGTTPDEFTLTRYESSGGATIGGSGSGLGFKPGSFAVHPDGPVYVVKDGLLVGVDVGMGAGRTASLPPDTFKAGTPTVMSDGTVVVPVATIQPPTLSSDPYRQHIKVLFLPPEGPPRVQTIPDVDVNGNGSIHPFKAIPNGHGGLIVMWNLYNTTNLDPWQYDGAHAASMYAVIDETGTEQSRNGTGGSFWNHIVLADDGLAWAVTSFGRVVTSIHAATGGSRAYFLGPSDEDKSRRSQRSKAASCWVTWMAMSPDQTRRSSRCRSRIYSSRTGHG